jgi:hypothetical protein
MKHARKNFLKIYGRLLFVFCSWLFVSCKLSPPQAPRWDTKLTLPIINERYSVQRLLQEEDDFYIDDNNLVHFISEPQLGPFSVDDRLAIGATSASYTTTFGRFTVPAPGSISTQIALREVYPSSVNLAGQTAPIPAFAFSLPIIALTSYDSFLQVESAGGTLTISLRNDLAVPLGIPLQLEISDRKTGTPLAVANFDSEIPPGGEATRAMSLAGQTFGNNLALRITGRSPGSRGAFVQIDPHSEFMTTVTLSTLEVSRATAKIGPQVISDHGEVALGDSIQIMAADLKSGAVTISAQGNLPVGAWMVLTLPDFYKANNAAFKDSFQIVANGNSSRTFDLAGHSFRPPSAVFGQQQIRFHWKIRTTNGPNDFATLASGDNISADFSTTRIVFSKLQGGFNGKTITISPQKFKIDLPEGLDSLRLGDVSLRVTLRNGINFPVRADFQIEGIPNQGPPVLLNVRSDIKAGQANGAPVESEILLHRANSNIVQFFNALPKSIIVRGKVVFGEPALIGSIRATDFVAGRMKFDAALALILPSQRVESAINALEIDKNARDELKSKLHGGKVTARFINHLPAGAAIALNFAQKRANVFTAPDLPIGPFHLAAPDIDGNTGRVVREKSSTVEIRLDEKQLEIFQKTPLYTGVLIEFPGTQGKLVRLMANDYIDINAIVEIAFAVDERKPE